MHGMTDRTAKLPGKDSLLEQLTQTRLRTMDLVRSLKPDDFVVQTAAFMSPPKWHIGHVSWVYEAIMSKIDPDYEFYSKEFSAYLNSYYQQFGVPHDKSLRGVMSRPTTEQIFAYFEAITGRVRDFIGSHQDDGDAARLITMGFHHECQHQELLIYDLQHLLADRYEPARRCPRPGAGAARGSTIRVPGGLFVLGYGGDGFCYDIEIPEHRVYMEDYEMDAFPVTNGQFLEFVRDGGYMTYRHWLADGWEKVRENGWRAPMYWEESDGVWMARDFGGLRDINPNEPVCHVSYYEADAYCRWAGKRLPTEAEWEKAACWDESGQRKTAYPWGDQPPDPARCNLLESCLWGVSEVGAYPEGASRYGFHNMIGDVWEWTSSEFAGYPGFRSGFDEYNDKWFTCQKVLRGGSFATPSYSIRTSYRNFFRLDERWLFSGFRCARDA